MYYIFTFRSRSHAIKFAENLRKEGAYAVVITTPQAIGNGCGLSVKTDEPDKGKRLLSFLRYASFTGLYQVKDYGGTLNIIKK